MPKKKRPTPRPETSDIPSPELRGEAKGKAKGKKRRKHAAPRRENHTVLLGEPHADQLLIAPPQGRTAHIRERLRVARTLLREKALRARRTSADWSTRVWAELRPGLKRLGDILGVTAASAAILAVLFLGYSGVIADRVLPNTSIAGIAIGGLRPEDARLAVQQRIDAFERTGITIEVSARSVTMRPMADLGLRFDVDSALELAKREGRSGDWMGQQRQRFAALFSSTQIALPVSSNPETVSAQLRGHVKELAEVPVEPKLTWEKDGLALTPGAPANSADMQQILADIATRAALLEPGVVRVPLSIRQPVVSDTEAERAKAQAQALVNTAVVLTYGREKSAGPWKIDFTKDASWIVFVPEGSTMQVRLDASRLREYLTKEVAPDINQDHADARIKHTSPDSWRVTVEGEATDGHTLLVDEAIALIQSGLSQEKIDAALAAAKEAKKSPDLVMELPSTFEPGLVLDESGQDVGLRDRLAYARSNFSSSPSGRDYNVRKGMRIYNGILIPKDAEMSFNSFLGPVDAAHGWKDALTIFQGGLDTRMEAGGGICQVSTTVYQAAVLAGLKIKERRAHSYFVSYYAKAPGLNGIDATIFPGSQDLVIVNDTPGPILMLAGTEGVIAWTQLYGIKDRTVELNGPFKSGSYGPGAPILTVDPSLAPGQVVIDKGGHSGHSVSWTQIIRYNDGREVKNSIFSGYKAIPSQGRKGPDAAPMPPVDAAPTTVAAN